MPAACRWNRTGALQSDAHCLAAGVHTCRQVQTVRKEGDAVLVAADFNADPFPVQDGGETVEPNTVKATLRSGLSLTSAYVHRPRCGYDCWAGGSRCPAGSLIIWAGAE